MALLRSCPCPLLCFIYRTYICYSLRTLFIIAKGWKYILICKKAGRIKTKSMVTYKGMKKMRQRTQDESAVNGLCYIVLCKYSIYSKECTFFK